MADWTLSLLGSNVELGTSTEILASFEQHSSGPKDEQRTQRVSWCVVSDKQLLEACVAAQRENGSTQVTNWALIALRVTGKGPKSAKQCRERWCNHVNPNIDKSPFREEEDHVILSSHATMGKKII